MDAYERHVEEMRAKYEDAKNHRCECCHAYCALLSKVYDMRRSQFVWACLWCRVEITQDKPAHTHKDTQEAHAKRMAT